jgi:hypothetical protein
LVQPEQTIPSWVQPLDPVVASSWHVPEVAPAAMLQKPVQQSVARLHTSPVWMQ